MVVAPLAAGAGAGIAASIVRVPTEVVKQRMQMGEFKSAMSAVCPMTAIPLLCPHPFSVSICHEIQTPTDTYLDVYSLPNTTDWQHSVQGGCEGHVRWVRLLSAP